MKKRLTVAIASLLVVSMGGVAFAQTPPQTTAYQNNNQSATSNSQIRQEIKQQLTSHGVTATNVHIKFSDGTATLSGTVFTKADINKAKEAARQVQAVRHVDTSNLHARSRTQRTGQQASTSYTAGNQGSQSMMADNASNNRMSGNNMSGNRMEQKIKQALTSQGVTATNVNVMFNDGTATLSGTVATQQDISKAKQAAMGVQGVKQVNATNLRAQSPQSH